MMESTVVPADGSSPSCLELQARGKNYWPMLEGRPRATLGNDQVGCSSKKEEKNKITPFGNCKPNWKICNKFWLKTT